jgi:chromosome segregation ATPase
MAPSKPELACESVLHALKVSRLTFSSQETPYSCYITIRKKFVQNPHSKMFTVIDSLKDTNICKTFQFKLEESEKNEETLINENKTLREEIDFL